MRPAPRPTPSRATSCGRWACDEDLARASLRFGLGRFTTAEEIDFAIDAVADAVARLRDPTGTLTRPVGARSRGVERDGMIPLTDRAISIDPGFPTDKETLPWV